MAIAPEFTIGFVRPPTSFDRLQRIERQAGGVDADLLAQLFRAQHLAHQGEDERLGDAHDRELVLGVAGRW